MTQNQLETKKLGSSSGPGPCTCGIPAHFAALAAVKETAIATAVAGGGIKRARSSRLVSMCVVRRGVVRRSEGGVAGSVRRNLYYARFL